MAPTGIAPQNRNLQIAAQKWVALVECPSANCGEIPIQELIVLPEAAADLDRAFTWYQDRRPGLGDEFFDEISAAFNRIRTYPLAYAQVEETIRRGFTRRFPYAIYFEVGISIDVFAVLHQKQAPDQWRDRAGF